MSVRVGDHGSIGGDAVFVRNASSLAALTLVFSEFLVNFEDEFRYMWRRPCNRVKSIYFFSRYIGLTSLTVNAALLLLGPLSRLPVDDIHCRKWFTVYQVITCAVMFGIDAIAMLRVYALYNRNAKVGALFSSLLITEATLVTTCSARTIGKVPFSPICDVEKTPFTVIYFTGGVVVTQLSLLFFTFLKRREMVGQRHIPILRLVFREGTWISTLICGTFLFIVPYSLITGTAKVHLVLIWPAALFSTAACRVILNMHVLSSVAQSRGRRHDDPMATTDIDIQFTTFLESTGFDNIAEDLLEPRQSMEDFAAKRSQDRASANKLSLSFPKSS